MLLERCTACCSLKCLLTPLRRSEMALPVIGAPVAEQWDVPENHGALGRALQGRGACSKAIERNEPTRCLPLTIQRRFTPFSQYTSRAFIGLHRLLRESSQEWRRNIRDRAKGFAISRRSRDIDGDKVCASGLGPGRRRADRNRHRNALRRGAGRQCRRCAPAQAPHRGDRHVTGGERCPPPGCAGLRCEPSTLVDGLRRDQLRTVRGRRERIQIWYAAVRD